MFGVEFELKQFSWQGQLKLEDITISTNKLTCHSEDSIEINRSVNTVLDLIGFFREQDIEPIELDGQSKKKH